MKYAGVGFVGFNVFAVLALVLASSCAVAEDYDVYILAGQSNMDGRGNVKDLADISEAYAEPQLDIAFWYANPFGSGYSTGWIDLAPGYSIAPGFKRGPQTLPAKTFGVEITFGPAMAEASPGRRVAIVKVSRGGTSLVRDWDPSFTGENDLYPVLIRTVQASLAALSERGDTGHLRGMVWHQGESDRKLRSYADRFEAFVGRVREDLGQPDLPVVIGEVFDNGKRDIIRQQQREAASQIPAAAFVSCDGLETYDGTHFTSQSLLEFGNRLAEAMKTLTADPLPGP